ncbi:MAG: Hsp33 family molecular chaperone HslO [Acholeplasmatales bacterium]|nr:MAG: Hsp33 family molecular chaperone HslO [Acholeplasmatales bacterium]
MKDYLVKATAFNKTVRVVAATTQGLCETARTVHDLWPTAAAALGRVLTVSAIMGSMLKDAQTLTIRIEADGPLKGLLTTSNTRGEVRGYVGNPHVMLQYDSGKLNVGQAVGSGFIHVTKDLKVRDTFTSSSPLQTGEIGEDFAYYFTASEQIPSAVGVGVFVETDNTVQHAGGFIVQVMPGCSEETLTLIEERIATLPPVTDLLKEGVTPEGLIAHIAGESYTLLETMPLHYHCDCSREKFERGLISLGVEELTQLLEEDGHVETACHFCGKTYTFDDDALHDLIAAARA